MTLMICYVTKHKRMLNTSSNNGEKSIFILQKGGENVNFRQQQRSLIKMYARTSLNTHAPKIFCKRILVHFKHSFKLSIDTFRLILCTQMFLTVFCKLSLTNFVCRLKNDRAQKLWNLRRQTWMQKVNTYCFCRLLQHTFSLNMYSSNTLANFTN